MHSVVCAVLQKGLATAYFTTYSEQGRHRVVDWDGHNTPGLPGVPEIDVTTQKYG